MALVLFKRDKNRKEDVKGIIVILGLNGIGFITEGI